MKGVKPPGRPREEAEAGGLPVGGEGDTDAAYVRLASRSIAWLGL
jgi:hypothetical protein